MCFAAYYSPNYGHCTPLSRESASETTLTAGTSVTFAASTTLQVSVAALDTERAVVCYEDSGNSGYGTCQRLWMNGASLVAKCLATNNAGVIYYENVTGATRVHMSGVAPFCTEAPDLVRCVPMAQSW